MRYCNSPFLVPRDPVPFPVQQHAHPWAAVQPRGWAECRDHQPDRLVATVHAGSLRWPPGSASRWHSPGAARTRSPQVPGPAFIYGGAQTTIGEDVSDLRARVRTRSGCDSRSVSPSLRPRSRPQQVVTTVPTNEGVSRLSLTRVRGAGGGPALAPASAAAQVPGACYVAAPNTNAVQVAVDGLDGTRTPLAPGPGLNAPGLVSPVLGPCERGDAPAAAVGVAGKENGAQPAAFRPQRRSPPAADVLSASQRSNARSSPFPGVLERVNPNQNGACLAGLRSNLRGARREDGLEQSSGAKWQHWRHSAWKRQPSPPAATSARSGEAAGQDPVITVPSTAPRSGNQNYPPASSSATTPSPGSASLEIENTSADALLEKEAAEVRKLLRDFEDSFLLSNGRPVRGIEDLGDMAPVYRRYRRLKAALVALKDNGD